MKKVEKLPGPVPLFLSYAHEDESLLRKLETHLGLLKQQGFISTWYNRQIISGADQAKAIEEHLERSSIILLLVSPDFLASSYCFHIEMRHALERHQMDQAYVVPIILRPVDWSEAPFAHLHVLPTDAKPVTTWDNIDEAFVNVVTGIRNVIRTLPLHATFPMQKDTMEPEVQRQWAEKRGVQAVLVRGEDMDPITATIVAVLTAGATSDLTETKATTITGAYHTLKHLLTRKFGARSKVIQAIDYLEAKPDSADRQETLQEAIAGVSAQEDVEILAAVKHLHPLIGSQPAGVSKFAIHNNALVQGQTIGDHATITQQFGDMPKR